MKSLSKLVLVIFSIIILVIGVAINLIAVNWLDFGTASNLVQRMLTEHPSDKIILVITEICMLFAVICIFADSSDKKEPKGGRDVLMQNDNGKLMISRDTIQNLTNTVVKEFQGVQDVNTRIGLDAQNNVAVFVDLTVSKNVVIKDMTVAMQNKIKDTIKKTSDLDVNEVNVRIKNVVEPEIEN